MYRVPSILLTRSGTFALTFPCRLCSDVRVRRKSAVASDTQQLRLPQRHHQRPLWPCRALRRMLAVRLLLLLQRW
jgi:hypothetical protein